MRGCHQPSAFAALSWSFLVGVPAEVLKAQDMEQPAFPAGYQQHRVTLSNYQDLQYVTYLNVGNQNLAGIIDTGSFELVIFSKACPNCGKAAKYDPSVSSTYHVGSLTNHQMYGSGETFSREASDFVAIDPELRANQTFWEVTHAQMPLLSSAQFEAIIGVGPPETAAADAWAIARSQIQSVHRFLERGMLPPAQVPARAVSSTQTAHAMSHHPPLLSTVGLTSFSICLGPHPGSDGYLIWNDTSAAKDPALFVRVPVIGRHTWTLHLTGAWLRPKHGVLDGPGEEQTGSAAPALTSLECESGCGAILDSGTSMLVVPFPVVGALQDAVRDMTDCSNLQELPDLVFQFGEVQVSLPPDSYVAEVTGDTPRFLSRFARIQRAEGGSCQLLVMESSSDSNYGPLWILGMPFFRSYYTLFEVGRNSKERAIQLTPAGEDCIAGDTVGALSSDRQHTAVRRIDPSKMLVSQNAMRAHSGERFEL